MEMDAASLRIHVHAAHSGFNGFTSLSDTTLGIQGAVTSERSHLWMEVN